MQHSLFDSNADDPVGAAAARHDGIGWADANAETEWKRRARDAVRECAGRYRDGFTADHVLRALAAVGQRTHNVPALGPVMLAASRAGEIERTGEVWPSTIRRRHRDLTVWRAR